MKSDTSSIGNLHGEIVQCIHCGWHHIAVSREYAEEEIKSFKKYYDSLTPEQQEFYYSKRVSDIYDYANCDRCGEPGETTTESTNFRNGCTLGPIIVETKYIYYSDKYNKLFICSGMEFYGQEFKRISYFSKSKKHITTNCYLVGVL